MMARVSTIERLPDDIRSQLQELLRDPRVTQLETTERINELLEVEGHDERISKSAVNRYAVRMNEVGEKLRQSREVAEMWIAKLGAQPQGQLGHLVNEMLRSMAFDLALKLQEGELTKESMPAVIEMVKELSLSVTRLEKASSENVKREELIRQQERARAAEEAADKAESAGRAQGLSSEGTAALRAAILEGLA
ncbi:DUF3486 family protein [Billgrantia gudaonensis]|uniref:Mu-like prophage FluMu protein gp27 n=1 Tax=Billgrantia gudaonensis TaxID=376427 RepID=A0A1G9AWG1_9GAMM|nr:DUF3486 family protein [Halomonas gudaonensis]SDK31548.1 Protein of unknown function [Halomonas gudaonensis]